MGSSRFNEKSKNHLGLPRNARASFLVGALLASGNAAKRPCGGAACFIQ